MSLSEISSGGQMSICKISTGRGWGGGGGGGGADVRTKNGANVLS